MKRLLIVDDQVLYLTSLSTALQRYFVVETANSYSDTLRSLHEKEFDVALIDIRLSEEDATNIDGLKILEWIKMNKPNVTVFNMSAYREFAYAEQALNLGAKHFFKKPIDIISLIAILKEKA